MGRSVVVKRGNARQGVLARVSVLRHVGDVFGDLSGGLKHGSANIGVASAAPRHRTQRTIQPDRRVSTRVRQTHTGCRDEGSTVLDQCEVTRT